MTSVTDEPERPRVRGQRHQPVATRVVQVRLTDAQFDWLQLEAAETSTSNSQVLRSLIEDRRVRDLVARGELPAFTEDPEA